MKLSKLIGLAFSGILLLGIAQVEARSHVNFGFGVNLAQPRYDYAPAYVEDYYYPTERVIVRQDPYGRTISEHVYVHPAQVRRVYVQPMQRVRPAARPFFSFGFFG